MKYKVIGLPYGQFAVSAGRCSYFKSTVTGSEFEAKQRAIELSAKWYQAQIDKCQLEWTANREQADMDTTMDSYEWGDVLA